MMAAELGTLAAKLADLRALKLDLSEDDRVAFAASVGLPTLDPWQRRLLQSEHPRILMNCSRQSGKSTCAALVSVHKALYTPGSLVLILSPAQRQSGEVFKKCMEFYRRAGRPVRPRSETALTLTLDNGSRIVSLPGRSDDVIRGYSADALVLDEASRISDDIWGATRPMLSVRPNSRILALSTPWGRRGWWHDEWEHGTVWERYRVTADDCPRITEEFLAEEKRTLPDRIFRQEYFCSFEESSGQVFSYEEVMGALDDSVTPLFNREAS